LHPPNGAQIMTTRMVRKRQRKTMKRKRKKKKMTKMTQ
jgi:hypothetical protein